MERKTKYRILGILIIVGLIITLLPLFLSDKEDQTPDVAVIKTPPFPDQEMQISGNNDTGVVAPPEQTANEPSSEENISPVNSTNNVNNPTNNTDQAAPQEQPSNSPLAMDPASRVSTDITDKNDKTMEGGDTKSTPATAPESNTQNSQTATTLTPPPIVENTKETSPKSNAPIINNTKKPVVVEKKQTVSDKQQHHTNLISNKAKLLAIKTLLKEPLSDNGLIDLKKPAWVIQIGSFKNKTNAIRVVNRLRSNGYRAFVQHVSNAAFGETVRVYVGPEDKQADAHAVLDRLEKDLHIAGIVISYKPLAL